MAGKFSCWEHFKCKRSECPVYGRESVECWREPITLCHGETELRLVDKLDRCIECPVFTTRIEDEIMCGNIINVHSMPKGQGYRPNGQQKELAVEFTEIYGMLSQISRGDFAARLPVSSATGMVSILKSLLNEVAGQMQENVEETHELAIGLCEHYETLNRISRNEFDARASEDSSNELIAKLGTLINKCTDTLVSSIVRLEQAEEETRNAYQQLLDIVDFLPDATFVIDREGCIVAWNRALHQLTGVAKEEMLGKGDHAYSVPFYGFRRRVLIDYLEDATDRTLEKDYSNIVRTCNTLSGETSITPISPDNLRHVWVKATPLYDKHGSRAGAIESIRDVTEFKRAEEEKTRLEAQLHHSRQMESLMLRLGHDLKTPLTPLFTLLPLIGERVEDPETRRMVEICCSNAQHILDLSTKTMRLASLSMSAGEAMRQAIDLRQAVSGICREFADILEKKNLGCESRIPAGTVVVAVFDQIRDLFSNLLSNAINASLAGTTIRITARNKGKVIQVAVQDEGIGLTREHRDRIFEEFFKVDEARHDLSASGLGLSICKRVVLNHRGRIWAESKGPGHGTSIVFTLPQAPVATTRLLKNYCGANLLRCRSLKTST